MKYKFSKRNIPGVLGSEVWCETSFEQGGETRIVQAYEHWRESVSQITSKMKNSLISAIEREVNKYKAGGE